MYNFIPHHSWVDRYPNLSDTLEPYKFYTLSDNLTITEIYEQMCEVMATVTPKS